MAEETKCIYYIKDLRTDKIIYIGQTKNFKQRQYDHFGSKDNQPIDSYMYNEGRENFTMGMFDIDCTNMTFDERKAEEDKLILHYDTINNGFNKQRSGLISKDKNEYMREYLKNHNYKHQREYNKSEKWKELHREYMREYYKSEKYKEYYLKKKKHSNINN